MITTDRVSDRRRLDHTLPSIPSSIGNALSKETPSISEETCFTSSCYCCPHVLREPDSLSNAEAQEAKRLLRFALDADCLKSDLVA